MSEANPFDIDALVEYFQRRTTDSLRGVFTYNEYGNIKTHYVEENIDRHYRDDELVSMMRKGLTVEKTLRDISEEDKEDVLAGSPKASLHTFEHGVVVQLFGPSLERGVIAVFEKDIASRHTRFVDEASSVMMDEEYSE